MLLNKNDDVRNDRILYQTKPNMLFGCKKAIFGIVLLAIVLMVAPMVIKYIGGMQTYLISRINLALTRYAAVAFFVIILIIIIYIIWQLFGWYSREYILTETRVIVKYGIFSTKKNYMHYTAIQDINTSQSIIERLFNVGSVYLYSAYDNNQMELSNIGNTSEVEEIIFTRMVNSRGMSQPRSFPQQDVPYERGFQQNDASYERGFSQQDVPYERSFLKNDDYHERNDHYDEFEPITPIGHERNNRPRREYEYYPDDLGYQENTRKEYEYEPYHDEYRAGENRIYDDGSFNDQSSNHYSQRTQYNELRNDYSYSNDDYYSNNDYDSYYNEDVEKDVRDKKIDVDESSEKVIRRHFDKFKR